MGFSVIEHIEHPFGKGALTTDGIQWSAEKTTSTDDYETVEEATVNPPALGALIEFEFGLTCAVKSTGSSEDVTLQWQARNKGGTWTDLHTPITYPADASAWQEYTVSGRFQPNADFNSVPCELRLRIASGSAGGENAAGRAKNSSYVKLLYAAS